MVAVDHQRGLHYPRCLPGTASALGSVWSERCIAEPQRQDDGSARKIAVGRRKVEAESHSTAGGAAATNGWACVSPHGIQFFCSGAPACCSSC